MKIDTDGLQLDGPVPSLPKLQTTRKGKYEWLRKALDDADERVVVPVAFTGTSAMIRRKEMSQIHAAVHREARRRGVRLRAHFHGLRGGSSAELCIEKVPPTDSELDLQEDSVPEELVEKAPEFSPDTLGYFGLKEARENVAQYEEGYEAFGLLRPKGANPYESGSDKAKAWYRGWKTGEEAADLAGEDE